MTQDDECRLDSTWVTICNELQQVISTEAVACWFRPLKVKRFDNQVLTLYHDQSIYSYWIEENYLRQLTTIALNVLGAPINIVFKSGEIEVGPFAKKVEYPLAMQRVKEVPLDLLSIYKANLLGKPAPKSHHLMLQS